MREMQMLMGGMPLDMQHELEVWWEAFRSAAIHTSILRTMERAGYEPPARVVDREVARLPTFQVNGVFSPALYNQLSESARLALWRQVQDDITRARFHSDIDGLPVSSGEREFMGRMASTERSFDMAVFPVDAFPDSEHRAYALANPELFRRAHLSMLTVRESEAAARALLDSVLGGEASFGDAARLHSGDMFAAGGGYMGARMAHELRPFIPDPAVLEAALALGEGDYSGVMGMGGAWVFFRAESDPAEADLDDPAVMGQVRAYMRSFARELMENWAVAQAHEFAASSAVYGFDAALAMQPEAVRRSFGNVPLNFGGVGFFGSLAAAGVPELAGAANNERFWQEAFSGPLNRASQPVVQGGNVLVLFPVGETEAHPVASELAASDYGNWLARMTHSFLGQHIMNSPRLDDRFVETFFRMFGH